MFISLPVIGVACGVIVGVVLRGLWNYLFSDSKSDNLDEMLQIPLYDEAKLVTDEVSSAAKILKATTIHEDNVAGKLRDASELIHSTSLTLNGVLDILKAIISTMGGKVIDAKEVTTQCQSLTKQLECLNISLTEKKQALNDTSIDLSKLTNAIHQQSETIQELQNALTVSLKENNQLEDTVNLLKEELVRCSQSRSFLASKLSESGNVYSM